MAVTVTSAKLATVTGLSDSEALRLLPVVKEIVQTYAVDAPSALQNEAAYRVASYLGGSRSGLSISSLKVGDAVDIKFRGPGSALRLSGGESLLAPYRVRRAIKAVAE